MHLFHLDLFVFASPDVFSGRGNLSLWRETAASGFALLAATLEKSIQGGSVVFVISTSAKG